MKCERCKGQRRIFVNAGIGWEGLGWDGIEIVSCPDCAGTGLSVKGLVESEAKANESHPGAVRPGVGSGDTSSPGQHE
jgi:hypothetical protein